MAFSITFFQFRKKHIMADILYFRLNNNHFQKKIERKVFVFAKNSKNRWKVEKSDIILYYIQRDFGGAYTAIKYATKLGKKTISVLEK